MKINFAGTPGTKERERWWQNFLNKRLLSFYNIINNEFNIPFAFEISMKNKIDIFLDSGAFSAFTQNIEIDINEYINFIKEHQANLEVYANLDVIGCPKGTWRNQKKMERAGLNPLPCFHYGEDIKWLKRYIDEGYKYIALGGMVPISTKDLTRWLDSLFNEHLTDADGYPIVKIHGFGLTSLRLMIRYPWYSVDSTSWVMTGRMGSIYVPKRTRGEWSYHEEAVKIAVSSRSPSRKEANQHISTLSPKRKEVILDYLKEKGYCLGSSIFRTESENYELKEDEKWDGKVLNGKRRVEQIVEVGISNDYKLRDELNIIYFLDLEKTFPPYPRQFKVTKKRGLGF
jgi:hypothetical protein